MIANDINIKQTLRDVYVSMGPCIYMALSNERPRNIQSVLLGLDRQNGRQWNRGKRIK